MIRAPRRCRPSRPRWKIVVAASTSCTCHRRHTQVGRRALHCCTEKRTRRHLSLGGVSHERKIVRPRLELRSRNETPPVPKIFMGLSAEQQRATVRGRAHALQRHHDGARVRVVHSLAVHVGDRVRSLLQRCKRRCVRSPSAVTQPIAAGVCTRALLGIRSRLAWSSCSSFSSRCRTNAATPTAAVHAARCQPTAETGRKSASERVGGWWLATARVCKGT